MDDEVEILDKEFVDEKSDYKLDSGDELQPNKANNIKERSVAFASLAINDQIPPKTDIVEQIQKTLEDSKVVHDFQRLTMEFIKKYNPPGHTIYFQPGFGKTRVACFIIAHYMRAEPWRSIIIVAPSVIHNNFITEFRNIKC
jgi:hypothetical protein